MVDELQVLLDRFWVLRETDSEWYYRIRDQETSLREFLKEKLGYQLIINAHLAKVEKIPGRPRPWMGFQALQQPMDYGFMLLVLSYLEDKGAEEQFVLSDLTEYIVNLYPGSEEVDWTLFQHRRSLVRVLKLVRELQAIQVTDGDQEGFSQSEDVEVLYESTGLSRYLMRSFTTDITAYTTADEILNSEWLNLAEDRGLIRRHRVYRRLLVGPAVYGEGPDDQDFLYIRNYRGTIERDFRDALRAQLHVHPTSAAMVAEDPWGTGFPEANNLSDIALQLAAVVRERVAAGRFELAADDTLELPRRDFANLVAACRERFSRGWYKTYREMKIDKLVNDVVQYLRDWEMVQVDDALRTVTILPMAVKLTGGFPAAFDEANPPPAPADATAKDGTYDE